jgi:hypothetical protein
VVDDLAEVVATRNLVLYLAEDLANLALDCVRVAGLLLEVVELGKSRWLTKSRRSSPVMAREWSGFPSGPFGAAQTAQR